MNLNDWAKKITLKEGKNKSLSIAQVKELLKIVVEDMANMPLSQLANLLARYKK